MHYLVVWNARQFSYIQPNCDYFGQNCAMRKSKNYARVQTKQGSALRIIISINRLCITTACDTMSPRSPESFSQIFFWKSMAASYDLAVSNKGIHPQWL